MPVKQFVFYDTARDKIWRGVDALAEEIKAPGFGDRRKANLPSMARPEF